MGDQTKEQTGYNGPKVGHRTPRTQALELGTDPSGFKDDVPYDVTAGHPITRTQPSQEYKEQPLKAPGGGKPVDIPAPFSLGSK